jgi:hypothetical protein
LEQYELHKFPLAECIHKRQAVEQYATRHSKNPEVGLILSSYVGDILRRICATVEGTLFKELTPQRMRSAVARHTASPS